MSDEQCLIISIAKHKDTYSRVALVVNSYSEFRNIGARWLWDEYKIWLVENNADEYFKASGMEFSDVYFYNMLDTNSNCVNYFKSLLRDRSSNLLCLHFYYSKVQCGRVISER